LGKPQNTENYDLYKADNIGVYIKKGIQASNNEMHVYMKKFLWVKELEVDGMRINY
jgi:hypothetical protein